MNKKKAVIITITAIIVVFAAVVAVITFSPGTITPAKKEDIPGPSNDSAISSLLGNDDNKNVLPEKMLGVWLDMNTDIVSEGTDAQTLYNEITSDFAFFTNFNPNTLIIKPDITGRTEGFVNYDGSSFDALGTVLSLAADNEWCRILVIDDSLIPENGNSAKDALKLLNSYEFDGVLINSLSLSNDQDRLIKFTESVKNELSSFPGIFLGIELYSLDFASELYNNETVLLSSSLVDFALINADCKTTDSRSFTQIMNGWNSVAVNNPSINFYCLHRNDKVYTGIDGWDDYLEIVYQFKELWDIKNIKGSCFYKLSELKDKYASTQRLSSMIYEGATRGFTVKQMTVSPTEENVEFTGVYDTDRGLFCNGYPLDCADGLFNVKYKLNTGDNKFYFENAGQYYTYRIYNNHPLVYTSSYSIDSGMLNVYSVCPQGSSVYSVIGGEIIEMSVAENLSEPAGYSVYSSAVKISKLKFTKAKLDIICKYNQNSITGSLGEVDFHSEKTEGSLYAPVKPTPFTDNGLGTALMCEVFYDNTEQLGILNSYDTYDPDKSTLPEGTLDYVNQINLTDDGNLRYELRSGVAVYAENCRLINNAFVMPGNNVSVYKTEDGNPSSTDIYFSYDWLSPVTVTSYPNNYETGYMSFSFNLEAYSAEYVDVKFAYTDSITNETLLAFSDTSVISYAEVITGTDTESTTLRLHLKKAGAFYGYSINVLDNNILCISLKKHSQPGLAGKVVMIDAGHGGLSMTGTAVANESICEAEVTLSVALKVRQILAGMGATVLMTRTDDTSLILSDRVKMCEAQNPDVFVSLHCDGADNKSEAGTHTFYFRPYSQPLAKAIHEQLVHHYTTYIYTDEDSNINIVNKKIKYYPFFVTRVDTCPSVLVEMGFMSNAVESSVLTDDNCQYWLADAIANGISDYFTNN